MTFGRRAAQEMIRRAQHIMAGERSRTKKHQLGCASSESLGRLLWAGTFHSVGARLLRQYALQLNSSPQFSISGSRRCGGISWMWRAKSSLSPASEKRFPRKDTCLAIYSHRINTQGSLEATLREVFTWCALWQEELTRLCHRYVAIKQRDRTTLARFRRPAALLARPDAGTAARARAVGAPFSHILVDEYQDTNVLQAEILRAFETFRYGRVCGRR